MWWHIENRRNRVSYPFENPNYGWQNVRCYSHSTTSRLTMHGDHLYRDPKDLKAARFDNKYQSTNRSPIPKHYLPYHTRHKNFFPCHSYLPWWCHRRWNCNLINPYSVQYFLTDRCFHSGRVRLFPIQLRWAACGLPRNNNQLRRSMKHG